jgi:predicted MPP superfamily phosphohydrolase
MNIRFLIISFALLIVVAIGEYTAYASFHYAEIIKSARLEIALIILGITLPIIFIISMLYSYKHYSVINSWLNIISSIWIGFIIYSLIASLIIFLLIILSSYFNFQIPIKIISSILMLLVFIVTSYGIWNSNNPRIVEWHVKNEALSKDWSGKKIVIISDVHLGTIRGETFFKKIIDKINNTNPDIVFIAGDLIDGPAFPYEKWLKNVSILNPKFGNLYAEGNHEKYNQEYSKFISSLPPTLINLTNKKVEVNNTQIIGLDYKQNESGEEVKSELTSLKYDKNQSSIILIHDPKNVEALAESGVSLVISGHTHGGQFFPITALVNYLYKKYTHGVTNTGKTTSITSYGVGTSILPIRIGTVPEIIVLTID